MKRVFLGGTCNDSTWRNDLIKMLKIDYFNPVVDDWTDDCMKEEIRQRETCEYVLYVITPAMTGVYSIAEVVDDSNKRPQATIFCYLKTDTVGNLTYTFGPAQLKSIDQVKVMVARNGAHTFDDLKSVATFLNSVTD